MQPYVYKHLTPAVKRRVREEYITEQDGKCYHCKEPLKGEPSKEVLSLKINTSLFPRNFFAHPVHLHHDHSSGLTIGAVHCKCNAVLWQYYGE